MLFLKNKQMLEKQKNYKSEPNSSKLMKNLA